MKVSEKIRSALAHPSAVLVVLRAAERIEIQTSSGIELGDPVEENDIFQFIMQAGGSRYVEDLGEEDVQWRSKVEAMQVTIFVNSRGGILEARIQFPRQVDTLESAKTSKVAADLRPPPSIAIAEPSARITAEPPPSSANASEAVPYSRRATDRPGPGNSVPPPAQLPRGAVATPKVPAIAPAPKIKEAPDSDFVTAPPPPPSARTAEAMGLPPKRSATPWYGNILRPAVSRAYEALIRDARSRGASDLHLIAGRAPAYRVGGELVAHGEPLPPAVLLGIVAAIVPQHLEERLTKEGSVDFALDHPELGRARTNVSRQSTGLKVCFRIIGREIPTLASLGLPPSIAAATHHHQGLIVVTGPSGHGKTSTLAALVDLINEETGHHVITVEDPIEYLHPRKRALLSQREVGTHTKSFAAALKGSLREDPEVIVVGELRDTETVRMAVAASETGHLVIGTMNTPSAAKTIDRIIDLFPPADQGQVRMTLAGGLRLIVSQRLVPTVDGKLAVAAELLPGNVPLWSLIRDGKTFQIPSLQQRGKGLGIIRLDDSLGELVKANRITKETAMRTSDTFATSGVV